MCQLLDFLAKLLTVYQKPFLTQPINLVSQPVSTLDFGKSDTSAKNGDDYSFLPYLRLPILAKYHRHYINSLVIDVTSSATSQYPVYQFVMLQIGRAL